MVLQYGLLAQTPVRELCALGLKGYLEAGSSQQLELLGCRGDTTSAAQLEDFDPPTCLLTSLLTKWGRAHGDREQGCIPACCSQL